MNIYLLSDVYVTEPSTTVIKIKKKKINAAFPENFDPLSH